MVLITEIHVVWICLLYRWSNQSEFMAHFMAFHLLNGPDIIFET